MRATSLIRIATLLSGVTAALCASLSATPLRADTCPAPQLAPLVAELTGWIADNSLLDTTALAAHPPEIVFCHPADRVAYEGGEIIVEHDLRAAYDVLARRIYLVEPWDAEAPRAHATLLHELVHVAQFDSRAFDCPQAAEWQAYRLQADWLTEAGIAAGFDWAQIFARSVCPTDVHP